MFVFRLYSPMGSDEGQVEPAIPTVLPGETIRTGDGRLLRVLDAAYVLSEESPLERC